MLIKKLLGLVVTLLLMTSPCALADMYDLTTNGSWENIGGAIFQQFSGIITYNSFLEIQKSDVEEGSNDGGSWSDVKTSETLLLENIPVATSGSVEYREFLLEINESGDEKSRLSLDQLIIFTANEDINDIDDIDDIDNIDNSNVIYKLNESSNYDNWIALDNSLSPYKGNGDILVYLPNSLFNDIVDTTNIFLYSHFGGKGNNDTYSYLSDDGREIWAVSATSEPLGPGPVPIPSTVWIFGAGLIGLVGIRRKIKK